VVDAIYASDPGLTQFLEKMQKFSQSSKNIKFDLNTSVTQNRFLIDFSSTILLAILSVLMIIFRTMDHLMMPLHNLSIATKEISKGNYDVMVDDDKQNKDMRQLIWHFNNMSKQIKSSREGLDTHNLYLETILKYSYGVIGLDKDKRIQLINPVIVEMLGMDSKDNFIGKFCFDIVEKYSYLKPLFSMTSGKLKQDFGEWSEEIEILLTDRYLLLSCQGAALEVESEILGYVIIVKDISQLKRAQKKAAWGEVAMRMAHEIKNPLTPILLSAQRLRNLFLPILKGKDLEIIDKTTNVIINQVKSMDAMVSAFADYANMPQIERKLVDLNVLVNQSVDLYDAQDNITIEFDLASDTPRLLLDTNNISRVLINLVKNSAESVEQKRDLNIKIATQYLSAQGIVRLTVQDDGDGFDAAIIDHVFEPYVTTKLKGSGLGMAIVHNIIEQHDGRIFVGNIEPHGAIITIEFDYTDNNKKE
jgi:nitrogen fixation/metabolism regulation signal transduction histidine kinase